uniref:Uncharacterized protein n=1 Tax=Solanum lycopersicum TaxID=4081 RepID=K4CL93_SOLLC
MLLFVFGASLAIPSQTSPSSPTIHPRIRARQLQAIDTHQN